MKVLFVTSMYVSAGASYAGLAVHRQAIELVRAGMDVHVLCPVTRFDRSIRSFLCSRSRRENRRVGLSSGPDEEVPVTYIPYPNVPLGISPWAHSAILTRYLSAAMAEVARSFTFEVIHSHHLFPVGYAAGRLAQEWNLPFVASAVGSDVHKHPHRSRGIRKRTVETVQKATLVCAVSRGLAEQIEELARPKRAIRVVRRGVDTVQFAPRDSKRELRRKLGLPLEGIGLCCVSRLSKGKGFSELLDAVDGLNDEHPALWLAVVGGGPLRRQLESEIQTRGLQGRVFLAGARDHEEISDWLNSADIFVLASYAEGLPNVVLEAMSCGRPVVATDVGGVAEAVQHGVTGFLVSDRSADAIRGAVDELINKSELRRRMGDAARRRILSEFTWPRSAARLAEVYRDAIRCWREDQALKVAT